MGVERHLQDSSRAELPPDHRSLPNRSLIPSEPSTKLGPVFPFSSNWTQIRTAGSDPGRTFCEETQKKVTPERVREPAQIRLKLDASNWTQIGFRLDKKPVSKGFRTETQIAVRFEFQSEVESESNLNPI